MNIKYLNEYILWKKLKFGVMIKKLTFILFCMENLY